MIDKANYCINLIFMFASLKSSGNQHNEIIINSYLAFTINHPNGREPDKISVNLQYKRSLHCLSRPIFYITNLENQ